GGSVAAIRHVEHVDTSHHLEQLSGEMAYPSGSSRCHVDLARIGFGVSNEFGDILCRDGWIDHHDKGSAGDAHYRRDVADKIKAEVVERSIARIIGTGKEECVTIGGRLHDGLGGDVAAPTGSVLDDELLAGPLR